MSDEVIAVAFLDFFGRFAKRTEDIVVVRTFYGSADSPTFLEMTREEYDELTADERLDLQNAPSAAGLIDTSTKSNA